MNYKKVHDLLIDRAKSRVYDSKIHHNHHITPKHENPNSTEVVPLTIREHALVHRLRYKMGFGSGNLFASVLLNDSNHEICSIAGKIGGKKTRENQSGIFSKNWDRSIETSNRHKNSVIKKKYFKERPDIAKKHGENLVKQQQGIFSPDWNRSEASKKLWKTGAMDKVIDCLQKNASLGGNVCKELGYGIHDKTKRKMYASLGGKVCGKLPHWTDGTINKKSNECPGEGWYRGRTINRKRGVK